MLGGEREAGGEPRLPTSPNIRLVTGNFLDFAVALAPKAQTWVAEQPSNNLINKLLWNSEPPPALYIGSA